MNFSRLTMPKDPDARMMVAAILTHAVMSNGSEGRERLVAETYQRILEESEKGAKERNLKEYENM